MDALGKASVVALTLMLTILTSAMALQDTACKAVRPVSTASPSHRQ